MQQEEEDVRKEEDIVLTQFGEPTLAWSHIPDDACMLVCIFDQSSWWSQHTVMAHTRLCCRSVL